jgi:HEPN domain-containing protein
MTRKDFQVLANLRLREARVLLRGKEFSGAYYLAGYAVECGLKACIARSVRKHDFYPNRKTVEKAYTHNLNDLLALANLEQERALTAQSDLAFATNWDLTARWSEASRYLVLSEADCRELMSAIMEKNHGVMPWLKKRW